MINKTSYSDCAGVAPRTKTSKLEGKKLTRGKIFLPKIDVINNSATALTKIQNQTKAEIANHSASSSRETGGEQHGFVNGNRPLANSKTTKAIHDSCNIIRLKDKQKLLEGGVHRFPICDVKAQEALKIIRKDKGLWNDVYEKLEVRAIKVKEEEQEIVLHPDDEDEARWTGKYHVYITIQHQDKKFIIDPYIGGKNSCAHVDERDFIKSNWQGKEGKDYVLDTIAPIENENGVFSVNDYIDDLFAPDTYESHKFYYQ